MTNIETAIQWFSGRIGTVVYSMVYRLGQLINGKPGYDCSSSVYFSLIAAGLLPAGTRIGNTDSLYNDLERSGWSQVPADANGYIAAKRGDIFLWGKRGASSGGAGHTGEFIDGDRIIHCSYGYNGIHVDNHDWLSAINGYPELTVYRYTSTSYTPPSVPGSPTDQILDIGSTIKFDRVYTANDVQLIGGIWQVRCNELCPRGFTWDDNGIPAEPLVELTDSYRTSDQELEIGSKFTIPGKFTVLDLGQSDGMWLALIEWNGLKFWVDVATATEIASSDAGAPTPGTRPVSPPVTNVQEIPDTSPKPVEPPQPTEPTIDPPITPAPPTDDPVPPADTNVPSTNPTPVTEPEPDEPIKETKPKENKPMAFTQEQQKTLAINAQEVLDANDEFTPVISDKVKTIAYFATDILATLSALVLTLLAIAGLLDGTVAITIQAAVTAALIGLKQTFRLSSKKQ